MPISDTLMICKQTNSKMAHPIFISYRLKRNYRLKGYKIIFFEKRKILFLEKKKNCNHSFFFQKCHSAVL